MNKLGIKLKIKFDKRYPDGTPRKVLDTSLAKKHGWIAKTTLKEDLIKLIKILDKKLYR